MLHRIMHSRILLLAKVCVNNGTYVFATGLKITLLPAYLAPGQVTALAYNVGTMAIYCPSCDQNFADVYFSADCQNEVPAYGPGVVVLSDADQNTWTDSKGK